MIKKYYLLSPGPTPVPERALSAAAEPIIHHRTAEFSAIFMEVTEGLKQVFGTKEDVYILTSSGTGAMETAVVNLLSPGDKVLTINGGKFGERWGNICKAYGVAYKEIILDPVGQGLHQGRARSRAQGHARLQGRLRHPLRDLLGRHVRHPGLRRGRRQDARPPHRRRHLGRGRHALPDGRLEARRLPVRLPEVVHDPARPGLHRPEPEGLGRGRETPSCRSSTSTSRRPRRTWPTRRRPGRPASRSSSSRSTPSTSSRRWAWSGLFDHHRILADATRAGVKALGLELLSQRPGNVLTCCKVPEGIDGGKLVKTMQGKYMAYIAGGQDPYKGKIFRIAHLGYMGGFDIITALSALEMTLMDLGYEFQAGAGITAAQAVLKENWQ